ncbi:MAG: hypothetical protein ACXW2J_18525, partial [Allosphingosinicella sp.]
MKPALWRKSDTVSKAAERVTVGIAAVAVAAAGTVIAGEVARLARRRRESKEEPPDSIGEAAGIAALDTVTVARKAYE